MFAEPTVVVELGMVLDCGGTCLLIHRGEEGRKDSGEVEVEVTICHVFFGSRLQTRKI